MSNTNTTMYPQGVGPFQAQYNAHMQQQAAAGLQIPQQTPQTQPPYQRNPPPYFPRVTETMPNLQGRAAGVSTVHRPLPSHTMQPGMTPHQSHTMQPEMTPHQCHTMQPGMTPHQCHTMQPGMTWGQSHTMQPGMTPGQSHTMQLGMTPAQSHTMQQGFNQQAFRPQNFQAGFEQSIQSRTNPNFAQNSASSQIRQKFPALQQGLNPSPPLPVGPQSGWGMGGSTARRSPQTGATAQPSATYPQQNRPQTGATAPPSTSYPSESNQGPSSTSFCPPSLQAGVTVQKRPPRLCHVIKGPGYAKFYGLRFFIYPDGPYVSFVQINSAAESSGLTVGDKIIEINGFNVESESSEQVLDKMKGLEDEMKLFVMDRATYEDYKRTGVKITSSLPGVIHLRSRPVQPGIQHLYPRQGQQPLGSPPMPSLIPGSARQMIQQQIPAQRPIPTPQVREQGQVPPQLVMTQNSIHAQTASIPTSTQAAQIPAQRQVNSPIRTEPDVSDTSIAEPDDKKLLGQWYLQPDIIASAPAKSDSSVNNASEPAQTASSTTAHTSTVSPNDPPDSDPAAMQEKIFKMLKKGTPYSNFNHKNAEASCEGHRPASGGSANRVEDQGTAISSPPVETVIDSKEGIKVTGSNDSNDVISDKSRTVSTDRSVSESGHSASEISPDIIGSINLANQLDLDKSEAMHNLNQLTMHLNYVIEKEFSVDPIQDTEVCVNVPITSASVSVKSVPETEPGTLEKRVQETENINSSSKEKRPSLEHKQSNQSEKEVLRTENNDAGDLVQNRIEHSKNIETSSIPDAYAPDITGDKEKQNKGAAGSIKLKVKINPPKKTPGSPLKKIGLTWKKKLAARAEKDAELDLELNTNTQNGASSTDSTENEPDKKKKKKRTSSEAELNEERDEPPTSKRGRGRGGRRGRGRGQARGAGRSPRKSPGSASGGTGRGRGLGRGRGRGRGMKVVVAPAQNLSWSELERRQATDGSPIVEVDVDEVAVPFEHVQDKASDAEQNVPDVSKDTVSTSYPSNQIQTFIEAPSSPIQAVTEKQTLRGEEKESEISKESKGENSEVKVEESEIVQLKIEPEEGDPEKPIIIKKTDITDNFESTELHTNANLIRKTDRFTFSWVDFHGCKVLLINSEDGDYLAMKELVFEVFRPHRPEKSVHANRSTPFKDLSKTHKIQHIYKTKEKRLNIMYREIDPEILELVYQILFEKRVLHKKQNRLGMISLVNALRLYHFITKVGTSECSDINLQCVVPHDSSTHKTNKSEMDLVYPINFNQGPKHLKSETVGNAVVEENLKKDFKVVMKNSAPSKSKMKIVEPSPNDIIEILDSDEESCASDTSTITLPYVDGSAKPLTKESDISTEVNEPSASPDNEKESEEEKSIELESSKNEADTDIDIDTVKETASGSDNSREVSEVPGITVDASDSRRVVSEEEPVNVGKFKGVIEFFDGDDDSDLDDITLIDIGDHGMKFVDEGDRRINELIQLRKDAKTEEEIDYAWGEFDQAIKIQRPIHLIQKAVLQADEKDKEQKEAIEKLKLENEELRKYVEQHKAYLDPMPECDQANFGNRDPANDDSENKS